VRLSKRDAVYTAGQKGEHVYLIESGWVKLQCLTVGGKSCVLGLHGAGDVIGETCLFDADRTTTAVALDTLLLYRLTRGEFLVLLKRDDVREAWLRYQTGRTIEHEEARTLLATVDSEHRLAAAVLGLAIRHGVPHEGRLTRLDHRFTQEELAEMVGTTRSRVGLFLKRFRQLRLVVTDRGGGLLVDMSQLRGYLDDRCAA
jgi:CRP/FNR family cyclic AMP-dependent transcriptional regulator